MTAITFITLEIIPITAKDELLINFQFYVGVRIPSGVCDL
jgi:hypothetical protein